MVILIKPKRANCWAPKGSGLNDEYQTYANLQHITEQVLRVSVATVAHR